MQPQVAFSTGFFEAFGKLPHKEQKKVRAFVEKFKQDPAQGSIHYEKLEGMRDDKVRTVRIGLEYRAVVIHPPRGDVFLCVHVDHHDEAMEWARRKRFEVNPVTGSMQVYEERTVDEAAAPGGERAVEEPAVERRSVPEGRLFGGRTVDELLLLGVPAPLIPAVFALRTEYDLDDLARFLPPDASDALYLVAAGYELEAALDELARKKAPAAVDTEDFGKAIVNEGSQASFAFIEDDEELAAILDAPLERWRIFLHPSQRKIVEMESQGSVRVLGGAGTGKTVVAMHRARHLSRMPGFLGPNDKLLFTTFTANLAEAVEAQLDGLCGTERARIEVTHLGALANRLVKARTGVAPKIATSNTLEEAWLAAMAEVDPKGELGLSLAFVKDEWKQVIEAQDVLDEQEYLKARRDGRGTRLDRGQRKAVFRIVQAFRDRLAASGFLTHGDVVREARMRLEKEAEKPYRAIIADETQDLDLAQLKLLRALVALGSNDLFLVGDAHQRIYGSGSSLGRAGISIRGRQGRRLRLAYRTTQSIHRFATALFQGVTVDDLDEGTDDATEFRAIRTGPEPVVLHHATEAAELAAMTDQVRRWLTKPGRAPRDLVVVASTHKLRTACSKALEDAGIKYVMLGTGADRGPDDAVRVATIHRVKGLEFPLVYLLGAQTVAPNKPGLGADDETADDGYALRNRSLLYVAATRARDELVVSSSGAERPGWVGQ